MPSPHSREAPRFSADHSGFDFFFDDVKELADRAKINDTKAIEWARRYAGSESDTWVHVPCLNRLANEPVATFLEFRNEVRALYPHLDQARRYTASDLQRVVDRCRHFEDMSRKDLGEYLRDYIKISGYLVEKNRLSLRERSIKFIDGFPQPIRVAILNRLSVTDPDVLPDDGYDFQRAHAAANWVLSSRSSDKVDTSSSAPRRTSLESGVLEELVRAITAANSSNNQLVPAPAPQPQFSSPQQFANGQQYIFPQSYAPHPQQPFPQHQQHFAAHPQYATQQMASHQYPHQSQFMHQMYAPQPLPHQAQYQAQMQQPPAMPPYPRPPAPGGPLQHPSRRQFSQTNGCVFCSDPTHFIRECPIVQQYLTQGKVLRDPAGRIRLLNGEYPPSTLPGRNMRERVDYWNASQNLEPHPAQNNVLSTNFLETVEGSVYAVQYDPREDSALPFSSSADEDLDAEEQSRIIDAKIASLRDTQVLVTEAGGKKKVRWNLDGVVVPPAPYNISQSKPDSAPVPRVPSPNIHARRMPERSETPFPPPVMSGSTRREEVSSERPTERPRGPMRPIQEQRKSEQPKANLEDSRTRFRSAVEAGVKIPDLADRLLDTPISVTTRELLAASGGVRHAIKDLVASKKVSVNALEEEPVDAFLTQCFEDGVNLPPPSKSVQADLFRYDPSSPYAVNSLPLRVIFPDFGNGVFPECVLDSGAQSIIMRSDVWERTRAPIAANKAMVMQSANRSRDLTMGMIENFPVRIGEVQVFLQIHVVKDAPFQVLLGRPFFDVTSCSEISRSGGHHQIHLRDPVSGNPYTFPTEPRLTTPLLPPKKGSGANFQE